VRKLCDVLLLCGACLHSMSFANMQSIRGCLDLRELLLLLVAYKLYPAGATTSSGGRDGCLCVLACSWGEKLEQVRSAALVLCAELRQQHWQ
jgi:hypothetical protein